jgi:hypothetical protein
LPSANARSLTLTANHVRTFAEISGELREERAIGRFGELSAPFIGRAALVRNKRATGRLRNLAETEDL